MPNYNTTLTSNITKLPNGYNVQTITPDYTGIYCLCGTVFIISMITLEVINKISDKWRMDAYKLKVEEIKQGILAMRDLSDNLKKVKILLEGLIANGNDNIINN